MDDFSQDTIGLHAGDEQNVFQTRHWHVMPNQIHDYRAVYVVYSLVLKEPDGTHGRRQEVRRLFGVEKGEYH
jgi:hypothetical protein